MGLLVLVVGPDVAGQLAPFEDTTLTGGNAAYQVVTDDTEALRAEYRGRTVPRYRRPDGTLATDAGEHRARTYRPPTTEERARAHPLPSLGVWRPRPVGTRGLPPGWAQVRVPVSELMTFAEFLTGYPHYRTLLRDEPGAAAGAGAGQGDYLHGYVVVDASGSVLRTGECTNPNAKWERWAVWDEFFLLRDGTRAGGARKGDVDMAAMRAEAEAAAADRYDRVHAAIAGRPWRTLAAIEAEHPGDAEAAFEAYLEQDAVRAAWHAVTWDLAEFAVARDVYVARAGEAALLAPALLVDGTWYEREEVGPEGVALAARPDAWHAEFVARFDALPDDALLTAVVDDG